jgi:hypothetical protein
MKQIRIGDITIEQRSPDPIGTRSSGGVAGLVTLIAASGAIDREA